MVLGAVPGQAVLAAPVGNTSEAAAQAAAPKFTFADVATSHWAHKYITKLTLQGIIQGDDRGLYNPEQAVSQQDVLILAVRLMGLEDEALKVKTDNAVLPFTVSDYARGYVMTAIDHNLINIKEESGTGSWGTKSATREWVAKVVIRAIGKQSMAENQTAQSSFKDKDKLSASDAGFVGAAVALKIVDGFDDNTFRPKEAVTRAQMSAFLSRAAASVALPSDYAFSGTVMAISSSSVQVVGADGQTRSFPLFADAFFYGESGLVTWSGIKPGYQVTAIGQDGVVYMLETEQAAELVSAAGVVTSVDVEARKLSLKADDGTTTTYDLSASVAVVDKGGSGLSLAGLAPGSAIELRRLPGATGKVVHITVKEVPVNKTAEGPFLSLSDDKKSITVQDPDTGQTTYPLSGDVTVTYRGGERSLDHLFAGDTVRFQVENNVVVALDIQASSVDTIASGKLIDLKNDNRNLYLTIKMADGRLGSYTYTPSLEVVLKGTPYATVSDLKTGDDVTLYIDSKSQVVKAFIEERRLETTYRATITDYNETKKYFIVEENGTPSVYTINENIDLIFGGSKVPWASFKSLFTTGQKVDLTFNGSGDLIKITLNNGYEGILTSVNKSTNELILKTVDNQYLTLKYNSYGTAEQLGKDSVPIDQLPIGTSVRASLNAATDTVYLLQTITVKNVMLTAKDAPARSITVREEDSTTKVYTGTPDTKLLSAGGTAINWTDLAANSSLKLTFKGKALDKIEVR